MTFEVFKTKPTLKNMNFLRKLPTFSKCCCGHGLSLQNGVICIAVYQLLYGILYIKLTIDHHNSEISDVLEIDETQCNAIKQILANKV